ncbi:MAG TPA: NAD-dependent epimerase/dehydratase family protein [Pilimelia sp.]|nr:NAD-dependent epimerase/dehydratase family protein [Pilimelia sp.]
MRLLVLGGTVFLGRAVARRARDAGHEVTCAARGESGPLAEGVRFVAVDRNAPDGLSPLAGEEFDAVVDVARRPSHVRAALAVLADRIGHWSFVSTCSVYADNATPGQRADSAPLLPPAPPDVDDAEGQAYGPCKVACEQLVRAGAGADRVLLCRAGLIVGPEDPSGRFAYWVRRLARGGEVLAPGHPAERVQFVDVRDLAGWLVAAAEAGLTGTYDGIGAPMPRGEFLAGVAAGVGARPVLTWVDQEFLAAHDVRPWMGERALPLWLPLPEYAGFMTRDTTPTLAAGLRTRDVAETACDTLDWLAGAPDAVDRNGLPPDAEAAVLQAWHERPELSAAAER